MIIPDLEKTLSEKDTDTQSGKNEIQSPPAETLAAQKSEKIRRRRQNKSYRTERALTQNFAKTNCKITHHKRES